jgi:hypothetical protein
MQNNPEYYGLPARMQLETLGENHLGIRKVIKSRIIRKDAVKIAEAARVVRNLSPGATITLICTRNICSKSLKLLAEEGINVQYTNDI